MSQTKVYDLTIEYTDTRMYKDKVIDAPGTLDDGLTHEQAALRKFIARIEELVMKEDPSDFSAKVKTVVAQ